MFERVTAMRAYERVVAQVEEAIHSGRLRPTERLPSERQLMEQFGVSRSTVREALRVLQSKGLVQSRPGDPNGPIVLPFSSDGLREQMASLVRVEFLSMRELLQFRMTVEGTSYRLAAILRTPAQLDALDEAMRAMAAAVGPDEGRFARADLRFHEAVAEAAGNKLLGICNAVMLDIVTRLVQAKIMVAGDKTAQMAESCRRHGLALEAIRDGDAEAASRLARQSIFDYYAPSLSSTDRDAVAVLMGGGPATAAPAARRGRGGSAGRAAPRTETSDALEHVRTLTGDTAAARVCRPAE